MLFDRDQRLRLYGLVIAASALLFGANCKAAAMDNQVGDGGRRSFVGYGLVVGLKDTGGAAANCPGTVNALQAPTRVGDLAHEQPYKNHLVGYGLVVGLKGAGDTLSLIPQTRQAMVSAHMPVPGPTDPDPKDVAVVMVMADLDPAKPDDPIDVTVMAMGDATGVIGGTLLDTKLMGNDNGIYADATGKIVPRAFDASNNKAGWIIGGGSPTQRVRRLTRLPVNMALSQPNSALALCIARAINSRFPGSVLSMTPETVSTRSPKTPSRTDFIQVLLNLEMSRDCAPPPSAAPIAQK